jgi:hypothetical protein
VIKIVVSVALSLVATLIAVVVVRMVAQSALRTEGPAETTPAEPVAAI